MNIGYRKPYCARENCLNGRNTQIESIDQTEKQSPRITDPACLTRLSRVINAGSSTSLFCQFILLRDPLEACCYSSYCGICAGDCRFAVRMLRIIFILLMARKSFEFKDLKKFISGWLCGCSKRILYIDGAIHEPVKAQSVV